MNTAPLTREDRCDRCSAAALLRVFLTSGELTFCGHHGREFRPTIFKQAYEVFDPQNVLELRESELV